MTNSINIRNIPGILTVLLKNLKEKQHIHQHRNHTGLAACKTEVRVTQSHLQSHALQILDSKGREIIQPVLSFRKTDHFFIRQTQRLHDAPLVFGSSSLGSSLALEEQLGLGKATVLPQEHLPLLVSWFLIPDTQLNTNILTPSL